MVGIFLVLLLPLLVNSSPLPDTYFPYIVGKALYGRILIEIVVGLWLVLALTYPAYRPPRSWILVAFFVYLVLALLAGIVGVSFERSLWSTYERMQGIVDLAHWIAFVVAAASLFRTMGRWWALLNFNLGVSLVMALLGVAQHSDVTLPGLRFLEVTNRVDITLGNATYVGAYMLVNVLLASGMLLNSFDRRGVGKASRPAPARRESRAANRRRRRRARPATAASGDESPLLWQLFWLAVIALDLWMLVLSATRGALVGLAAGVLAFGIMYTIWGQHRSFRYAALGVLGIVLLPGIIFYSVRNTGPVQRLAETNLMVEKFATVGSDDYSINVRLDALRASIKGVAARPILGWGPENYTVAYDRYVSAEAFSNSAESFDQAHNKLVEELATKGALGLISYIGVWLLAAWIIVRRIRDRDATGQLIVMSVGAALAGYFVQNLFLFDTPSTVLQLMLLLAFVVSLEFWYLKDRATIAEETQVAAGPAGAAGWLPRWRLNAFSWPGRGAVAAIIPQSLRSDMATKLASPETRATYYLVMVAVILLSVIILFNIRPYVASKEVLRVFEQQITWEERFNRFEDSFDLFPQLANYPRLIMFNLVADNWNNMTEADRGLALTMVEEVGRDAIKAEPRGWRNHVSLANLYHLAAPGNPELIPVARSHMEKASEFAPERVEVYRTRVRQEMVENDMEGAIALISEYRRLDAQAVRQLRYLEVDVYRTLVGRDIDAADAKRARDLLEEYRSIDAVGAGQLQDLEQAIDAIPQ